VPEVAVPEGVEAAHGLSAPAPLLARAPDDPPPAEPVRGDEDQPAEPDLERELETSGARAIRARAVRT
jgi:hypothetical protein